MFVIMEGAQRWVCNLNTEYKWKNIYERIVKNMYTSSEARWQVKGFRNTGPPRDPSVVPF